MDTQVVYEGSLEELKRLIGELISKELASTRLSWENGPLSGTQINEPQSGNSEALMISSERSVDVDATVSQAN
jgi:hypothetical protein